jgi:hypothetical protein
MADKSSSAFVAPAFAKLANPTYVQIVGAVRKACDALRYEPTFERAADYCAVLRLAMTQYLRSCDRDGRKDGSGTDLDELAKATRDGNRALVMVQPGNREEIVRLSHYLESCRFRWSLMRVLREEGLKAAIRAIENQRRIDDRFLGEALPAGGSAAAD